jgi:lysophospholipase L1-like esterase
MSMSGISTKSAPHANSEVLKALAGWHASERSVARTAALWVLEGAIALILFCACLALLDLPKLDVYPDHAFKLLRHANVDNVYRDEDYSRYHVNSWGLMGREPHPVTDTRVYRIALFGDSFVEALQVAPDRKFAALIERTIVPPTGKREVEVWNFGHSADNTGNAYARWLSASRRVPFDFVIFAFNEADAAENRLGDVRDRNGSFLTPAAGGFRLIEDSAPAAPQRMMAVKEALPRLHNFTYLLRTRMQNYASAAPASARARLRSVLGMSGAPVDIKAFTVTPEQLDDTAHQLRFVHERIAAHGTPVVLLALPTDAAAPAGFGSHIESAAGAYRTLTSTLRSSGTPLIDPYPGIAADIAAGRDPYSDWDPFRHFNARGHQFVADAVVDYVAHHPELDLRVRPGGTTGSR